MTILPERGRTIGEDRAIMRQMGNPRKCIVSFRDGNGVEHVAEVTAESLYEAGALALLKRSAGAPRDVAIRHKVLSRVNSGGH